MSSVMSSIKKTMDEYDHMMGIPVGSQPGEERIYYDPISQYGGYTVDQGGKDGHLCMGGGESFIGSAHIDEVLKNFGYYVAGHELGHRGCYPDLPFMGMQWTAEIVRHYLDVKRGFVNWDKWATPFAVLQKMVGFKTFSKGRPCYKAYFHTQFPKGIQYKVGSYENCWTILYRLPLLEFGVDTFRKVLTANANLSDIKYSSLPVKTERLVDLYCKATKHNLIPFFNFFNIQVSDEVQDPCKAQPMPTILSGYLKVANCLSDDKTPESECVKMPEFPDYKGLCLISGVCQSDPDQKNEKTTFDNKIDIYGANNTRDTEKGCHDRAKEFFIRCGNDENHQITATYSLKNGRSTNATVPLFPLPAGNCYYNGAGRITMPHYTSWSAKLVAADCNKKCKDENYSYFGLQNANECWCGNKAPSLAAKLEMTKCNRMCSGNSSLRCGGADNVNAWKVCTEENCNFSYE